MATGPTTTPRERERELVAATRALFDERGMQDAPVEEIARAVGIARGLIYRHFSSKEELFVLTVTDYLHELSELLEAAIDADDTPAVQLERCTEAYADFCRRYPAFLDCSLSLTKRPAAEMQRLLSDSVAVRLVTGMASCVDQVAQILRRGAVGGDFVVGDPDVLANVLWTQTLGTMHLARLGAGVRRPAGGAPELFAVDADTVVRQCVDGVMARVGLRPRTA
jgi:AcrR family transcriptional regulator